MFRNTQQWPKTDDHWEKFFEMFNQHLENQDHINSKLEHFAETAQNRIRYTWQVDLYNPSSATVVAPPARQTYNDILVTAFIASVPTGAGTVVVNINDKVIPLVDTLPHTWNQFGLSYRLPPGRPLNLTVQNSTAGLFVAFFGYDLATSGLLGDL